MEKAVVLMSGGLNSAVAAATLRDTYDLHFLFANFWQRPLNHELRAFEKLCEHFAVRHQWKIDLSHFKQVGGNALVDPKRSIEPAAALAHDIASTFVPALIPTLLDAAVPFAFRIGARHIVCGVSEIPPDPGPGRSALYPDNRREFFLNYQYMLETALPEKTRMTVDTPLIDFDRGEIVKLGSRLGVPFEATWSCYHDGETPCGSCYGCVNRGSGFQNAATPDPLLSLAAR